MESYIGYHQIATVRTISLAHSGKVGVVIITDKEGNTVRLSRSEWLDLKALVNIVDGA